eukprot:gene4621-4825_t
MRPPQLSSTVNNITGDPARGTHQGRSALNHQGLLGAMPRPRRRQRSALAADAHGRGMISSVVAVAGGPSSGTQSRGAPQGTGTQGGTQIATHRQPLPPPQQPPQQQQQQGSAEATLRFVKKGTGLLSGLSKKNHPAINVYVNERQLGTCHYLGECTMPIPVGRAEIAAGFLSDDRHPHTCYHTLDPFCNLPSWFCPCCPQTHRKDRNPIGSLFKAVTGMGSDKVARYTLLPQPGQSYVFEPSFFVNPFLLPLALFGACMHVSFLNPLSVQLTQLPRTPTH